MINGLLLQTKAGEKDSISGQSQQGRAMGMLTHLTHMFEYPETAGASGRVVNQ